MDFLYQVWNYKYHVKRKGINITIQGDSIAARYSGFWINDWKIMLDAGLQSPFNPEHIFITHTHSDHIEKLSAIITGISTRPNIYVPYGTKEFVQNYLDSMSKLTTLDKSIKKRSCAIIECNPGDVKEVVFNGKKFQVKIFQTDHTINSIGFAFSEYRKKLKSKYQNVSKKELVDLIHLKVELSENVLFDLLVYTGDTRGTIFNNKNILDWNEYKVIITECTFIQELSQNINVKEHAYKKGHNYLQSIVNTSKKYANPLFILCHWSMRYNKNNIKKFFNEKKYNNIEPFINICPFNKLKMENKYKNLKYDDKYEKLIKSSKVNTMEILEILLDASTGKKNRLMRLPKSIIDAD